MDAVSMAVELPAAREKVVSLTLARTRRTTRYSPAGRARYTSSPEVEANSAITSPRPLCTTV
jgi:hypothetical protein